MARPRRSKPGDSQQVNQDAEYHDAGKAGEQQQVGATGLRLVPTRVKEVGVAAS
jgi:hypothetical protein